MTEAYVFDAIRTPRGRGKKGALNEVKPIALVSQLLSAMQARNSFEPAHVEDLILGCVTPVGDQGGNIAKAAINASQWDYRTSGMQLNRFCASGLEAVNTAAARVRSGWDDLLIAGGVESMSRVPMGADGGPWAFDPKTSLDTDFIPQGVAADLIATLDGVSREEVDAYAVASHKRAAHATREGYFKRSLIPVVDQIGQTILAEDEFIRPDTSMEGLRNLKPSFSMPGDIGFDVVAQQRYPQVERINHVHTAGNSSGVVDGAALVLIGNEHAAKRLNLKPRARILATALVGTDPTIMLTGPVPATRKALERAGLSVDKIDLFEVNEAFSIIPMRFMREMGVPAEKVNVNGGSIALGHPLGATGAMLIGTLVDELERRGGRYGVATLCVGGGMGIATVVERF